MKHILTLAAFFAFLCTRCSAALEAKPNIIVILADDMGWADLGVQGVRQGSEQVMSAPFECAPRAAICLPLGFHNIPHR